MTLSRAERYQQFIEWLRGASQREKNSVNRKMLNVFFWCFALPALLGVVILLLVHFRILPMKTRTHLDWILLIFPVFYSIYSLSFEVLRHLPSAFRQGGVSSTLRDVLKESDWRKKTSEQMQIDLKATPREWSWIARNLRMDVENLQSRVRFLTGLAGAVLFLILQGFDFLGTSEVEVTGSSLADLSSIQGLGFSSFGFLTEAARDFRQLAVLFLFLTLLYLSGMQTVQSLRRYLYCVELLSEED